jgi:hypothetical protein
MVARKTYTISQLVTELEDLRAKYGDIQVELSDFSGVTTDFHVWSAEPFVHPVTKAVEARTVVIDLT